jgi:hypothetical protein
VLVVSAAAAEVDPKALVLAPSDLPRGFVLDREESGLRTNVEAAKDGREARELIARTGRITGYEVTWSKRATTLDSRADLCRRAAGARVLLDFIKEQMQKAGIKGLRRARAGVGAESWIYFGGSPAAFTLVAWRYERVFAGIVAVGLTRAQTLGLARKQQRRIVTALR